MQNYKQQKGKKKGGTVTKKRNTAVSSTALTQEKIKEKDRRGKKGILISLASCVIK